VQPLELDFSPSLLTKPALPRLGRDFRLVDFADACCRGALVEILDEISQRIFTALGFALDLQKLSGNTAAELADVPCHQMRSAPIQ
jgi:hypothetical protein